MAYNVLSLQEDLWAIEDGNVRMYLIKYREKAVLLDTGYGSGVLDQLVQEVSGVSVENVTVIHTHSHGDHTSGDGLFHQFIVSEVEKEDYLQSFPENAEVQTVKDGDRLTFGEVVLEVLGIPGHTPGAIALLDRKHRCLFSGDSFASGWPIYMQYPGQDLEKYLNSMQYMKSLSAEYDTIYPCHGTLALPEGIVDSTIKCVQGILEHKFPEKKVAIWDGSLERAAEYKGVTILY